MKRASRGGVCCHDALCNMGMGVTLYLEPRIQNATLYNIASDEFDPKLSSCDRNEGRTVCAGSFFPVQRGKEVTSCQETLVYPSMNGSREHE